MIKLQDLVTNGGVKDLLEAGDYAICLALNANALELKLVPTEGLPGGTTLPSTQPHHVLAGPISGSNPAPAIGRALIATDCPFLGTMALQDIGAVNGNIIPEENDERDLGATGKRWKDLWCSGAITGSFNASQLTGSINDARLSANVPLLDGANVFTAADGQTVQILTIGYDGASESPRLYIRDGGLTSGIAAGGATVDTLFTLPANSGTLATTDDIDSVIVELSGAANGLATLDGSGKLTSSQLPDLAISDYLGSVASQAAMLALTGQKGDWCVRSDTGSNWVITGSDPAQIGSWTQLTYPASPVTSVAGRTGAVTLSNTDISGLGTAAVQNVGAFTADLRPQDDATYDLGSSSKKWANLHVSGTVNGQLPAANLTGTVATARLGSGTANSSSFLRGDQTWAVVSTPTIASTSSVLKGDGNGNAVAASAGTDYLAVSGTAAQTITLTPGVATVATGSLLTNTTAATSGNQQYSPALRWTGQGWKTTATAASQAVDFRAYVVPVQGSSAPTGTWTLDAAINGGSFSTQMQVTSDGQIVVTPTAGNTGSAGLEYLIRSSSGGYGIGGNSGGSSAGLLLFSNSVRQIAIIDSVKQLNARSDYNIGWASNGSVGAFFNDTGLARSAAGVVEVNNGTNGTLRDIVARKYLVGSSTGPTWSSGSGSPESAVTAPVGSLYSRTDGGASTTLYVKESGSGNTGWVAK